MRLVIVSDTHGDHDQLGVLEGDVLIHCGDGCEGRGRSDEAVTRLDAWFARQRFRHVLCVAGNHDLAIETRVREGRPVFRHARLLHDEGFTIDGFEFYGSPWVPELSGMAFYADDRQLQRRWAAIPQRLDVLITHTPPEGVLDQSSSGARIGCPRLRAALGARSVGLHCFGHVHHDAGIHEEGGTTFVNAAQRVRGQRCLRPPVQVDLLR